MPAAPTWPPVCKVCEKPGPKNRWENTRAQTEGWFLQRNGDVYCPEHVPGWVAGWRARQAERARAAEDK